MGDLQVQEKEVMKEQNLQLSGKVRARAHALQQSAAADAAAPQVAAQREELALLQSALGEERARAQRHAATVALVARFARPPPALAPRSAPHRPFRALTTRVATASGRSWRQIWRIWLCAPAPTSAVRSFHFRCTAARARARCRAAAPRAALTPPADAQKEAACPPATTLS